MRNNGMPGIVSGLILRHDCVKVVGSPQARYLGRCVHCTIKMSVQQENDFMIL